MADDVTQPIPFLAQASGLEQLGGASPAFINAFQDSTGTIRQRPGISRWTAFPNLIPNASPVVAMVPFGDFLVYATEDRKLFAWQGDGLVVELSSPSSSTQVAGNDRIMLTAFRQRVIATGGSAPQTWTGSGLSARLGGDPPAATHCAALATRALLNVNNPSGTFRWSGLGDTALETWDALNFTEAEARPDVLRAIYDNTNELFAFGASTLQVYSPDSTAGFVPGRTINLGLLAPYSPVRVDEAFAFLDRERRIILTDGRTFQSINDDLSKTFDTLPVAVTDMWGYRAVIDQWDFACWTEPNTGRAFLWERGKNQWSEWREFGSTGWRAPSVTSCVEWPEKNLVLVGLSTGQIAQLDGSAFTDLGAVLKVQLTSGFSNYGTDNYKHCKSARFVFRRGETAQNSTAPEVSIAYRDDLGSWENEETESLGVAGDYNPYVEIRSAGRFKRRQWKVEFTSNAEFSFVGASVVFEPLGN